MKRIHPAIPPRKTAFILAGSIAALLGAALVPPLNSADVTWDITPGTEGAGDSLITGGTGTWDETLGNWTIDGGLNNILWSNASNDIAIFRGTGGTVTLGGGIFAGGLIFNNAGYSVTGNTLTLGGAATITANANATISSVITGSSGLAKAGAGVLTLDGAKTYSGDTVISSGTLKLNGSSVINGIRETIWNGTVGDAQNNIEAFRNAAIGASDATGILTTRLHYQDDGSVSARAAALGAVGFDNGDFAMLWITDFTPNVSGQWGFRHTGAVDDNDSFWIDTDGNGTFEIGNRFFNRGCCGGSGDQQTPSLTAGQTYKFGIVMNDTGGGGWLQDMEFRAGPAGTWTDIDPSAGGQGGLWNVITTSSNILPVTTAVKMDSNTTFDIDSANQRIASLADVSPGAASGHQVLLGSGTLTVGDATSTAFAGAISGTGRLTKVGTGTLTLTGANNYTGSTTISEGVLSMANLGSTSGFVLGGAGTQGRLNYTGGAGSSAAGITVNAGGGRFDNAGSGAITLNGTVTGTGGGLTIGGAANTVLAKGVVLGSGTFTKVDGGTLTISGSGSAGAATISGGTVIASAAPFGSATVTVDVAGTLKLQPSVAPTTAGLQSWYDASTLALADGAAVTAWSDLSGNNRHLVTFEGTPNIKTNVVNGLSAVNFRNESLQQAVVSPYFAKDVFVVFRSDNGTNFGPDWGAPIGVKDADDNNRMWMLQGGEDRFWNDELPSKVVRNGVNISSANQFDMGGINAGQYMLLKVTAGPNNGTHIREMIVGSRTDAWSNSYFDTAEILAFDHELTAGEENQVGFYLGNKYGISSAYTDPGVYTGPSTLGGLSGSGQVDLNSTRVTVGSNNASTTFSGALTDSAGGGTVTKTGNGTLTLSGNGTYAGATTVNAGRVQVNSPGSYASTFTVNTATMSGDGTVGGIVLSSTGTLKPGVDGTVGTMTTGTLSLASGSVLDYEFSGANSDLINVTTSNGLTINGGSFRLYDAGTTNTFSTFGTYKLFQYAGAVTGLGNLSPTSILNKVSGTHYGFATLNEAGNDYVALTISSGPVWNGGGGDDNWSSAANWSGVSILTDDTLQYDGNTRLTSTNDQVAVTQLRSIVFRATAGDMGTGFTIGGNGVSLIGDFENNLIRNDSAVAQTINLPLTVAAAGKFVNAANGLGNTVLGGNVNNNGNTLLVTGVGRTTISATGTITGSGGLTKSGNGTMSIEGATTFTGDTRIVAGTLNVGHQNALANTTVDMNSADAGALTFSVPTATLGALTGKRNINLGPATVSIGAKNLATTYEGVLSGGTGLTKVGSAVFTLGGANTYTGPTNIEAGTLRMAPSVITDGLAAWFDASALTGFTNGQAVPTWTDISGNNRNATQANAAAQPTYRTNVLSGLPTVRFDASDDGLLVNSFNLTSGGYTFFAVFNQNTGDGGGHRSISGSRNWLIGPYQNQIVFHPDDGWNSKDAGAQNRTVGQFYVTEAVRFTAGNANFFVDGVNKTTNAGADQYPDQVFLGKGPHESADSDIAEVLIYNRELNTEERNAVGAYLGAKYSLSTAYSGGGAGNRIPDTSAVNIALNATLDLASGSETVGPLAGAGNVLLGTSATSRFTVTSTAGNDTTFSGVISGAGGLTKTGPAALTLSGANTFTGDTRVGDGTLKIGTPLALQFSTLDMNVADTGTFDMNGNNVTLGGLMGTRGITLTTAAKTLSIGNNNLTTSYSGALTGTLLINKIGTGTTAILGDNTYSGRTTITSGVLNVGNGSSLSPNSNLVFSGTSPVLEQSGTFTRALGVAAGQFRWLNNGGFAASGGPLALRIGGNTNTVLWASSNSLNTFSLILNSPTADNVVDFQNGLDLGTAARTINVLDNTASTADWAQISGTINATTGSLIKTGAGKLVLAGNNTFTAGITVNAGTVQLAHPGALNSTTPNALTFGASSTGIVQLNGNSVTVSGLTSAVTTSALENASAVGATLTVNKASASQTFAGVLQNGTGGGALSLTKAGAGTLILTGTNTFTGPTLVTGGILQGSSASLPSDIGVSSGASVTFDQTTDGTFKKVISGAGGITKAGTAVLTLAANNSYTGTTSITAGTLKLGKSGLSVTDGLQAWYDASTLAFSNGQTVTSWADLSGNNHTATLTSGTPVLATNALNGQPVVQFRGNDDYLNAAGTLFAKEMYYVFRSPTPTWSNYGNVFGKQADDRNSSYLFENGQTYFHSNQFPAAVSRNGVALSGNFTMAPIDQYMVLKVTVNDGNTTPTTYRIGGQGTYIANMDLAEIIAYNRILNATEQDTVGGYLESKYNIDTTYSGVSLLPLNNIPDTSTVSVTAGATLNVNGNTEVIGPLSGAGSVTLGGGNLAINSVSDSNFTGVISGTGVLAKTGAGTQTLSGANAQTYTGSTSVQQGILALDFASMATPTNLISASSPLILSGGKLRVTGKAGTTSSQTFAGTTLSAGDSAIESAGGGAGTTTNIVLGAITRQLGGTADFNRTGTAGSITTTTPNTNGILGGWATYGGNTWATFSGGIIGLSSYASTFTAGANNVDVTGANSSPAGDNTVNSLRFNGASAITLTIGEGNLLTLNSGGVLVSPAVGANATVISGGTLQAASGKDLILIQNNTAAALAINSAITDDGTSGVTKSGPGALILGGANTFGGPLRINGGSVRFSGTSSSGPVVFGVGSSGVLQLLGQTITVGGLSGDLTSPGSSAVENAIASPAGTLIIDNSADYAYAGILRDGAGSAATNLVKTGSGTQILAGNNTFTGTVAINGGILQMGSAGALNSGSPRPVTLDNDGTLRMAGNSLTLPGLVGTPSTAIENMSATSAILTVNKVSGTDTFEGILRDGTGTGKLGITKTGAGTLVLTGPSTFTGQITVSGGKLQGSAASLPSAIALSNSANVTFDEGTDAILSKSVSGTGSFTKEGAGVLTVAHPLAYTGATLISNGTLRLQGEAQLGLTANLTLRLDATKIETLAQNSDGSSPVTADGQPVGFWNDLSVASNHDANVTNAGWRPVYTTNALNGKPALTFTSGSHHELWVNYNVPNASQFTIAFAYRQTSLAGGNHALFGNDNGGWDRFQGLAGNAGGGGYGIANNGWQNYGQQSYMDNTDLHRYVFVSNPGVANGSQIWIDGVMRAQFTEGHDGSQQAQIALANIGVGDGWNGNVQIGEVVAYSSALNGADVGLLDTYLNQKWVTGQGGINPLPSTTSVTMAENTVFDVNNSIQQIATLTGPASSSVTLGAGVLTIGDASSTTFPGAISGTDGSLVKAGSGTLTLTGTNTYTGETVVGTGTLKFGRMESLYGNIQGDWIPGNITVSSGATLAVNVGGNGEFGDTEIATLLDPSHLGASTATTGLLSGAIIGFDTSNSGGSFTYTGTIDNPNGAQNTLGIIKLGAGELILAGPNSYTGVTQVKEGTLTINVAGSIDLTSAINVDAGTTLDVSARNSEPFTIAGGTVLTSNGTVRGNVFAAAGTTLTGTGSFQQGGIGPFSVSVAGIIQPGDGSGTLTIGSGANPVTLDLRDNSSYHYSNAGSGGLLQINGDLTVGTNVQVVPVNFGSTSGSYTVMTWTGADPVNSPVAGAAPSKAGAVRWINGASGSWDTGANWDVGNQITGGVITKVGKSFVLSNLTVSLGTPGSASDVILSRVGGLAVNGPAAPTAVKSLALGNGTSATSLTLQSSGPLTVATTANLANNSTLIGPGTLRVPNIATPSGTVRFDGAALQASAASADFITGGATLGLLGGGVTINTNGHEVTLKKAFTHDPALGVSLDGGLTKTGSGTLVLSNPHTYTGSTSITEGTLKLLGVAGLTHRWSFNDGTANDSIGTANGTLFGSPQITGGQLVLNTGQQNKYMTAPLTGETIGARTIMAWATIGNLAQGGGSAIMGLDMAGADNFDSIVFQERTTGQWMNGSSFFGRTPVNNGGPLETSTGEVMIAITYDTDNSIKIYRNGVRYDTNASLGTLITRVNPIAVIGRREDNTNPSFEGSVNEARIYNTPLSAAEIANLFTAGPDAAGANILPSTSVLTMSSNTTLDVSDGSQQLASLRDAVPGTTTGHQVLLGTGTLTVGDATSGTFSGAISGNGGKLVKVGNGTLTLSGANSYTGKTTVNAGTLQIGKLVSLYDNAEASWIPANITVASGATLAMNVGGAGEFGETEIGTLLDNSHLGGSTATTGLTSGAAIGLDTTNAGGSFTYNGTISNPNGGANALGLTKLGAGELLLTGVNTYTGVTRVKDGTLTLSDTGAIGLSSAFNVDVNAALDVSSQNADPFTVPSGAVLTANGTVRGNVFAEVGATLTGTGGFQQGGTGPYSVSVGGTIQPGDGTGTLTVGTGANPVTLDLRDNSFYSYSNAAAGGLLQVNGDLIVGTNVVLNPINFGSLAGSYTILSWTGADPVNTPIMGTANPGSGTGHWIDGASGNWDTGANWDVGNVVSGGLITKVGKSFVLSDISEAAGTPGPLTDVVISRTGGVAVTGPSVSKSVKSLVLGDGTDAASLTLPLGTHLSVATTATLNNDTRLIGPGSLSATTFITSGTVRFDGVTLKAEADSSNFASGGSLLVQAGGIGINTNGHALTLKRDLAHDPALGAAMDGGLTKSGSGTLTIEKEQTYNGVTSITGGTLKLAPPSLFPTTGLLGKWTFDDSTANDGSGNNYHGTAVGNPTFSAADTRAGVGNALVLDGASAIKVDTGGSQSVFDGGTSMTVSAWVKGWPGVWSPFVSKNGEPNGWQMRRNGGNNVLDWTARGLNSNGGSDFPSNTTIVSNGQWHMVTMTYDGTARKIYVDGVLDATRNNTETIAPSTSMMMFGARDNGGIGSYFNGKLDDIYFYNRALTADEIALAYTDPGNGGEEGFLPSSTVISMAAGTIFDINDNKQHLAVLRDAVPGTTTGHQVLLGKGRLTVGDASSNIFSGAISGDGGTLVKVGSGALTLSGTNTYTGTTTVNEGTFQLGGPASLYGGNDASWTPANITVESGATLVLNVGGAGEFGDADVATLLDSSHLGGGTASNGIKSGVTLGFDTTNSGGPFTYSGAIGNGGGGANKLDVSKLGAGEMILAGASTYTGVTRVNAGTLKLGATGSVELTSAIIVDVGATLDVSLQNADPFAIPSDTILTANGTVRGNVIAPTGTTLTGTGSYQQGGTGPFSVKVGGTIQPGDGNETLAVGTIANPVTLNFQNNSFYSYSNASGSGGLIQVNGSLVVGTNVQVNPLNLVNTGGSHTIMTWTGADPVNNLVMGSASGGSGLVQWIDGASGNWDTGANWDVGNVIGGGTISKVGKSFVLSGLSLVAGTPGVDTDVVVSRVGGVAVTGPSAPRTIASLVLGDGVHPASLTLQAGAPLSITNTVTLNDDTTLNGPGTLAAASFITNGTVYFNGVTLKASADSSDFASGGSLLVQAGGVRINTNGHAVSLQQVLTHDPALGTEDGGLTKTGDGVLTIESTQAYDGITDISRGTLKLGSGDVLPTTATVRIASSAALDVDGVSQQITSLAEAEPGTTTGHQVLLGSGTLTLISDDSSTFSGTFSGDGGTLVKNGSGTLTLRGLNTHTGGTTVTNGTVTVSGGGTLAGSTGTVTANGGTATVDLGGTVQTIGVLSLVDGAQITNGTLNAASVEVQSGSVNAILAGPGTLTKTTGGVVTLNRANTHGGNSVVLEGTLELAHQHAVQNSTVDVRTTGTVSFQGGIISPTFGGLTGDGILNLETATLEPVILKVGANGADTKFAGSLNGTGSLVKEGSGTLILSNASNYSGTTVIEGGTLRLSGAALMPTIAGLQYQLDASNAASVIGGATVTQWNDVSGNGRNFTTILGQPTLVPNVFGNLPGIDFGGVSSPDMLAGAQNVNAKTVIIVNNPRPFAQYGAIWGANGLNQSIRLGNGALWRGRPGPAADEGNPNDFVNINGANGSTWITTSASFDVNTSSFGAFNTPHVLVETGNYSPPTTVIGGVSTAGDRYYNGGIGEVLVYNTVLTDDERIAVQRYLSDKWLGTTSGAGVNILPFSTDVLIGTDGVLDVKGVTQQVASLADAAPGTSGHGVNLNGGKLIVDTTVSTTFSGFISGGGAIEKNGTGTLTLAGDNSYSGATTVSFGTINITGNITNSPVSVNGGVFAIGNGASTAVGNTGPITLNAGIIAPGNSLVTGSTGILSVNGDLTIANAAPSSVHMTLNEAMAGSGYDQIKVLGSVTLDAAASLVLNGSLTSAIAGGSIFYLLDNDGTDAISGFFEGLDPGDAILDLLTLNGSIYRISYTGDAETNAFEGAGNDIALTLDTSFSYFSYSTVTYPGIGGEDVDFDGDGYSNWLEYVLGTDPTVDSTTAIGHSRVGGKNQITFTRPGTDSPQFPNEPGKIFVYRVEYSDDGINWDQGGTQHFDLPPPAAGVGPSYLVTETFTDHLATGRESKRFIRLRVTKEVQP